MKTFTCVALAVLWMVSPAQAAGFDFDNSTNQQWRRVGLYDDGGLTPIAGAFSDDPAPWFDNLNYPNNTYTDPIDGKGVILIGTGGSTMPPSPTGSAFLHWDLNSPDLSSDAQFQSMTSLSYQVMGGVASATETQNSVQAILKVRKPDTSISYFTDGQFHSIPTDIGGAGFQTWQNHTLDVSALNIPAGSTILNVNMRFFWGANKGYDGFIHLDNVVPSGTTPTSGEAFYSITGGFAAGTDVQKFMFNLDNNVSATEPLEFATHHYGGGTNAAGDTIASGGFDPTLGLRDGGSSVIQWFNDDRSPPSERDSLLERSDLDNPMPPDIYVLELDAFDDDLAGRDPNWAVDLIGPSNGMTLFDTVATGGSAISSVKFGTTDTGSGKSAGINVGGGRTMDVSAEIAIGVAGTAELIAESGTVVCGNNIWVGGDSSGAGGNGNLTVTSNGDVSTTNELHIWNSGSVDLNSGILKAGMMVNDNGTFNWTGGTVEISATRMWIDNTASATSKEGFLGGALAVGSGKKLIVSNPDLNNSLEIGHTGQGSLIIEQGGKVESTRGYIGAFGSAQGEVTVRGANSTWTVADQLRMGQLATTTGTLNVQDGGKVSCAAAYFGHSGGQGFGTVEGTNSLLESSGEFNIGLQGDAAGSLNVRSGGSVTAAGLLRVGWMVTASGELLIGSGGSVSSASALIGDRDSATGVVNVGGAKSSWVNTGDVWLGNAPTGWGEINIDNDGSVEIGNELKVRANGTVNLIDGTLTVATLDLSIPGGVFNFQGGTLHADEVFGDLLNQGGVLAPGRSAGITAISGSYSQAAGGALVVELGGVDNSNPNSPQFDQVEVTGTAALDGELVVELINPFFPDYFDSFPVLSYGTRVGAFSSYIGVFVAPEMTLAPIYGASDLTLVAALPGDGNLDGVVNFDDFVQLSNNFNTPGTGWQEGNYNLDGITNFDDFVVLSNHFGSHVPSPVPDAAMPEPSTLVLIGWVALHASIPRAVRGARRG